MEKILTIAAIIALGLLLVIGVVSSLVWTFGKEKRRKIHVVRKRETLYPNHRYYGGSDNRFTSHYTIDCRYPDSDKIHTLDCSYAVFDSMKEGKSYMASIKALHIISVSKK